MLYTFIFTGCSVCKNVSTIEYATSTYNWPEWHDNTTHCNKLWKAHEEREVNDLQYVLATTERKKQVVVLVPSVVK